jgi:hypothetical protein
LEQDNPHHWGTNDFATFLASNPNLKCINFGHETTFSDVLANLMTQTLTTNKTLERIVLDDCDIQLLSQLHRAFYNPQTIQSMFDCNHICYLQYRSSFSSDLIQYEINDFTDPKDNIDRKLLNLLSCRHKDRSNCSHFKSEGILDTENTKFFPDIVSRISNLDPHYQDIVDKRGNREANEFTSRCLEEGFDLDQLQYVVRPVSILYEVVCNFFPHILQSYYRAPQRGRGLKRDMQGRTIG